MTRHEAIRCCYDVADVENKDLKCIGCPQDHKWLAEQLKTLETINFNVTNLVELIDTIPVNKKNNEKLLRLKYELLKLSNITQ